MKVTDTALDFVKGKVAFIGKSTKLTPDALKLVDQIATALKEQPQITKLRVEAHTDSEGSDQENIDASTKQAQTVVDLLVAKGIAADRLVAVGYGESRPIAKNDMPAGRAKNRRVGFTILAVDGKDLPEPPPPPKP